MRPGTSHPARDRKRRLRSEVNDGALCQTVNLISEMSKLVPLLRVLLVDANSINLNIVRPFIRAAQAVMSASPVSQSTDFWNTPAFGTGFVSKDLPLATKLIYLNRQQLNQFFSNSFAVSFIRFRIE